LVRRRTPEAVLARVVSLSAGGVTTLSEEQLERISLRSSVTKDAMLREASPASWLGERAYGSLAAGVRHAPVIDPGLRVGATDGSPVASLRLALRLSRHLWAAAPFAAIYDAERPSAFNWFAWAGIPTLSGTREALGGLTLRGFVGAGADARYQSGAHTAFYASASVLGSATWSEHGRSCASKDPLTGACSRQVEADAAPRTWSTQVTLGASRSVYNAVTFSLGMSLAVNVVSGGRIPAAALGSEERGLVLGFGSVQRVGLRTLPLVQVMLNERWGVDLFATGAYVPALSGWVETYLAGLSYEH
jgi:hypothetical protein